MANPIDGDASDPERDALFQGLTERYARIHEQDKIILDALPLEFMIKAHIYGLMAQVRTLQRYWAFMGRETPEFELSDALFIHAGLSGITKVARSWGYKGPDDSVVISNWLESLMAENRARLSGVVFPPNIPTEEL